VQFEARRENGNLDGGEHFFHRTFSLALSFELSRLPHCILVPTLLIRTCRLVRLQEGLLLQRAQLVAKPLRLSAFGSGRLKPRLRQSRLRLRLRACSRRLVLDSRAHGLRLRLGFGGLGRTLEHAREGRPARARALPVLDAAACVKAPKTAALCLGLHDDRVQLGARDVECPSERVLMLLLLLLLMLLLLLLLLRARGGGGGVLACALLGQIAISTRRLELRLPL
jgi:hypothetical protein